MNFGIIFAGGVGKRMNRYDNTPKQFLEVGGVPIIVHTLRHFNDHPGIDAIVVACVPDHIDHLNGLIEKYGLNKVIRVVEGGATSQLSICAALRAADEIAKGEPSCVLIHDGVRPLITGELITQNLLHVEREGSCITCAPVTETIVETDDTGYVKTLLDRRDTRAARAPQSFWLSEILAAHENALAEGITDIIDCCTMMRRAGKRLYLLEGPEDNIKITTVRDLYVMRAILQQREDLRLYQSENES